MQLRFFLLFLLVCSYFRAVATHIVGGEIDIQHIADYNYRLSLNLYFDEINGDPNAKDPTIYVTIFEKGTNRAMLAVPMRIREQTQMDYTNISCTTGELKTSLIVYYEDIYLDPALYISPQGYYAVWERCCRNNNINNITAPQDAGTAFYMEFPAVVKNGTFFQNSSPKLSPPPNDYACQGELFSYNFSSADADGDVLVYDLVTPLNGHGSASDPAPVASGAPYPEVSWLPGYNITNQIQGTPPVTIDRNSGQLVVNPGYVGLFVFGVRCQEFRDGEKIGEVRRDFQLLVKDCPRNETPAVQAKAAGSVSYYKAGQVIRISPTDARCLNVFFTDPDNDEPLELTAKPVNFDSNSFTFTGQTTGVANAGGVKSMLQTSICFDKCLDSEGGVYLLDLIVRDDGDQGCSLPRQDTLRLSFIIAPTPDQPPGLTLSAPNSIFEVAEGDVLAFDVTATDPDGDEITVSAAGKGFDLGAQQISFPSGSGTGQATASFRWQIDCSALQQPVYQIEFTATATACGKPITTKTVEVRIKQEKITNNHIAVEQAICYGSAADALTGTTPQGGSGHYTYMWEVSTADAPGVFTPAPGDNSRLGYIPAALAQTSWFRRSVAAGPCTEESVSEAVKVTVVPLPAAPAVASGTTCPGGTVTLRATAPDAATQLQWYDQPTAGNLLHTGTFYQTPPLQASTDYYVQALNSSGCTSAGRVMVTAGVLASTADAGENITIIQGGYAGLKAKGGTAYIWSPAIGLSDAHVANPSAKPSETTTYTVTVSTAHGCTYTDEVTVTVLPRIMPANAVTLNGDEINDKWYIRNIEHYPNCRIQVYTRWGALIFDSRGYQEPWDGTHQGKPLPMAAYYYIIDLGIRENPISGSITLIK